MAIQIQYTFLLLLISTPELQQASAELIREQGYSVSTVLDGNKLPHRLIFSSALVTHDTNELLILDSPNSVFYTISIPISNGSQINKFAGNGTRGFADGGLTMAMFDRPLSFAVDMNGIVYVADRKNRAIRKITKSGVTTIAGGHSGNPGNVDGPALEASFSDDFDLIFVRELCALLILDRGNGLIRQMNLDPNDCRNNYKWKLGVLGVAILSVKYFIFVVALGLFFGLFVYPCVIGPRGNRRHIMQEISVISPDNESLPTRSVQTEVDANVSKFGRLLTWKPSLWQPLAGSLGLVKRNRS